MSKIKYGGRRWGGGWLITYSLHNAFDLKGKRKETQLRGICAAFGLSYDWVLRQHWRVKKSGNRGYHPATYYVTISNRPL